MSGERRALGRGLEILVPLALVGIWAGWTAAADSIYFPEPAKIVATFESTWVFDRFGSDAAPSLGRMVAGYLAAALVGVALGVPLGLSRLARRALTPIVEFLRAIPPPALIPAAIVVLGTGDTPKIALIGFVCLWPILLNTIDGVAGVDPLLRDTARAFALPRAARLRAMILPAASPQIFAGMRTSLSLALIMMVISEMVASTNGIGYFVLQSQRSFALPEMWSGILLLGLLGISLNALFGLVERRVLAWHRAERQLSG